MSSRRPQDRVENSDLHVLEGLVTYRLMRVADTLLRAAAQVYRDHHDVTVTELRLLATIGHHQPLALNEVSRLTGIDKAWVSRSLTALVSRDFVARRGHPTDSRITLLSLTRKGRAKVRQIVPFAVDRNERFLGGMSRARRTVLVASLDELQVQAEHLLAHSGHASPVQSRKAGNQPQRQRGTAAGATSRTNDLAARNRKVSAHGGGRDTIAKTMGHRTQ